ncbi:APM1 Aminopeptidase, partial [Acromyrmex insinuator]
MNLLKPLLLILILNYAKSLHIHQYFDISDYGVELPNYVKPDHYEITLEQQDEESNKEFFRGICVIFARLIFSSRTIYLHAQKPHIELDTIIVNKQNSTYYGIVPDTVAYYRENHMYSFTFEKELTQGHYVLNISFLTFLDNNKENFFEMHYKNVEGENEWMLATQFYPIGARQVFPCLDDPVFKATFNISIKHFSYYMALSNMPARNIIKVSQTMTWTYFRETPVMSTYLVAIMLAEFPNTSFKEINFRYHTLQAKLDTEFAQSVIKNITLYFESKWLCFQKLPKADHVAIPNFLRDGVEYWGLIFYREAAITYNKKLESVGRKVDVARLIAQKITHQWYTNLISPTWWTHLWLFEGLTTLLATDAINEVYPEFRIWDLFVVQIHQESLRLNSIIEPLALKVNNSSEINSLFSFAYYVKGPTLLRMLQHAVSKELFHTAMKKFLNIYSRNADKFWIASQAALEAYFPEKRFDVTKMINNWIYPSQHYPVLKITKTNSKSAVISVENYNSWEEKMPLIPVTTITLQLNSEIHQNSDIIWLKPTNNGSKPYDDLVLDFNFHWIIINIEQAGYYRVNYEADNWRNIANYLYNNYKKIHVLNRAQMIDDAFYFLIRGQFELSVFFELANYLQRETDYVAWFPMFKALEYINLLNNIGYLETFNDDDFTKSLRQEAARWACIFGVSQCLNNASFHLLHNLRNPDGHRILSWWKSWTFCNGLTESEFDNSTWWLLYDTWKKSNDNAIMEFASCSRSSYVIHNYLNLTINTSEDCNSGNECKDVNMLAKKRVNRFLYTIAKHAKERTILEYIKENYEKIKPK